MYIMLQYTERYGGHLREFRAFKNHVTGDDE